MYLRIQADIMKPSGILLAHSLAAISLAGALAGCYTQPVAEQTPWISGYTCCNLHYDGDWISDANYTDLPFIPAGAPISVTQPVKDSNRAYATVALSRGQNNGWVPSSCAKTHASTTRRGHWMYARQSPKGKY